MRENNIYSLMVALKLLNISFQLNSIFNSSSVYFTQCIVLFFIFLFWSICFKISDGVFDTCLTPSSQTYGHGHKSVENKIMSSVLIKTPISMRELLQYLKEFVLGGSCTRIGSSIWLLIPGLVIPVLVISGLATLG